MNSWLAAFVLTVTIEIVVAVPLLGWLGSTATRARRAGVVAVASAITHPLLWIVVRAAGEGDMSWIVTVLAGEIAVTAIEAVVLVVGVPGNRPDRRQRVLVAILMNAASAIIGLAIAAIG